MDYSLPYDEYLKNFRKTHHPSAQAMSEDQYNFNKAAAEKQAKMNAAEEAGTANWWGQKGEADKVLQEATGKENPTKEDVQKSIQDIIDNPNPSIGEAKGNPYENRINIDDTKAIGATKEELDLMLQDGQISRAAYEKQLAALNTPEVQEEMARGEKKADETVWDPTDRDASANDTANTAITDSVSEAVTPKKDDPPGVISEKNKYNKSMMSIWDAYRAGEISKETAGYFTIDAIATLAKNLGRSIGNVGAQFSGGTIDNGHDTSMWEQRRDSMFGTELQKETEGIDTFENKFKQLSYNRSSTLNDLIEAVKSDADKLSDENPLKIAYLSLAAMIASGQVDGTTTLAATGAKGITELFNLFKGKDKK